MATHNNEMTTMDPPSVADLSTRLRKIQMGTHNNEMAITKAPPDDDLSTRLRKIPQELQDEIFEFTIAICTTRETGSVIRITDEWRSPWQMQINKASRTRVAKRYYSDNIFMPHFGNGDERKSRLEQSRRANAWLTLLPAEHIAFIEEFRTPDRDPVSSYIYREDRHLHRQILRLFMSVNVNGLQTFRTQLTKGGVQLPDDCVKSDWEVAVYKDGMGKGEDLTGGAEGGGGKEFIRYERRWFNEKEYVAMFHRI